MCVSPMVPPFPIPHHLQATPLPFPGASQKADIEYSPKVVPIPCSFCKKRKKKVSISPHCSPKTPVSLCPFVPLSRVPVAMLYLVGNKTVCKVKPHSPR